MIDPQTIIDGRYEVLQRVGSGGMADVYLVTDHLLGRRVAVKVLHHRFAEDQEFVERFRREASAAAGLSHPNVVGIFDRGEWDGTYYIAMEYLPGRTLKQIVREQGALSPAAAIDVTIQILRAARFAHRRGVIHRDLKPHNVILDEEGRAKVTDFGIARAGASDMTLTGSIMGTAQYLSPEQAQGHAVSEASDLYAVGVVLYELLTGRVPFDGETAITIALQHISSEPQPPSAFNPSVPPRLDAIVLRALAKEPFDRYASADELIAALEQARAALPQADGAGSEGGGWSAAALGAAGIIGAAADGAAPHGPDAGGAAAVGGAAAAGAAAAHTATHPVAHSGTESAQQWPAPVGLIPSYRNGSSTGSLMPVTPAEQGEPGEDRRGPGRDKQLLLWGAGALLLAMLVGALAALLLPAGSVTVPKVVYQSEARAIATLRHAGLKAAPTSARSTSVEAGKVVTQTPSAGTEVKSGTAIGIVISTGPGVTKVPSIAGLPYSEAIEKLNEHGLKAKRAPEASETVAEGDVISTDPQEGATTTRGTHITVHVSTGPAKVKVPDVTEELLPEAEEALAEAGLHVAGSPVYRVDRKLPAETVISQTPQGGKDAKKGAGVRLVVAKAPSGGGKSRSVAVPSVLGEGEKRAAGRLEAAGFLVSTVSREVKSPGLAGTVVAQSPVAGTNAKTGSTVTVYVAASATSTTTTSSTSTSTTSTTSTSTTSTSTTSAPPGP